MKNSNRWFSAFIISAFFIAQSQVLQATNSIDEEHEEVESSKKIKTFEPIRNVLQKIKSGEYLSRDFIDYFRNIPHMELKYFESMALVNDEIFDSWVYLVLLSSPQYYDFKLSLTAAKEKGENDLGTASAQNNLGFMFAEGIGVNKNLEKAALFYEKAAIRGFSKAQYNLGFMYHLKVGLDKNLLTALQWYLESINNKYINENIKNLIKGLIFFIPSSSSLEDQAHIKNNQDIVKDNIETLLGLHDMERGINQPRSSFKEADFAIPSLFYIYEDIVKFEELMIKIIRAYDKPGFMITCLQTRNRYDFESSNNLNIKYYFFQKEYFLTLGEENVLLANELIKILLDVEKIPSYVSISKLLKIQKQREMSYLAETLNIQSNFRYTLIPEDQILTMNKVLVDKNKLIEEVNNSIKSLTQLLETPKQLEELLIEGISYRNEIYLQKSSYIESFFKSF